MTKKFKVICKDTTETGWYSSPDVDYGIVETHTPEEACKIIADREIHSDKLINGRSMKEIFQLYMLTAIEV